MKRFLLLLASLLLIVLIYFQFFYLLNESKTLKMTNSDPFKKTMVPSQFFEIDTKNDTVIEAEKGTKVVFQKNCFVDAKGKIVKGNIKFELAEALDFQKMIFSNLTTISNNNILETGGMIFIKAYQGRKEVFINKNKPIYIEIPTNSFNPEMKIYKGIRDTNGNMNWINPKPLQNYLIEKNSPRLCLGVSDYTFPLERSKLFL